MPTWLSVLDWRGRSGRVWFATALLIWVALQALVAALDDPVARRPVMYLTAAYVVWLFLVAMPRRAHDIGHTAHAFWKLWLVICLAFAAVQYLLYKWISYPDWFNSGLAWWAIFLALLIWPAKPGLNEWGVSSRLASTWGQRFNPR